MELMANLQNTCVFSQSIYSYKVAGVIAVDSDVCSAGFCKMKSQLTSAISESELQDECNVMCHVSVSMRPSGVLLK